MPRRQAASRAREGAVRWYANIIAASTDHIRARCDPAFESKSVEPDTTGEGAWRANQERPEGRLLYCTTAAHADSPLLGLAGQHAARAMLIEEGRPEGAAEPLGGEQPERRHRVAARFTTR